MREFKIIIGVILQIAGGLGLFYTVVNFIALGMLGVQLYWFVLPFAVCVGLIWFGMRIKRERRG
jgi:hypothetical protein